MDQYRKSRKTIDMKMLSEVAIAGIYRAYIFSALSDKIKNISIDSIDLERGTIFDLANKDWNTKHEYYKEEFQKWVACKCIEDIIESFECMVNGIYDSMNYFKDFLNDSGIVLGKQKSFKEKIKLLERCKISINHKDSIETLIQVRKCLTHRQGHVGKRDLEDSGGKFKVIWYFLDAHVVGSKDGKEHIVTLDNPLDQLQFDEDGQKELVVKYARKEKEFLQGNRIIFAAYELQEICFTMFLAISSLYRNFVDKAKELGLQYNIRIDTVQFAD